MSFSSTLNLYPEGELIQAPLATPLSGPRLISPNSNGIERENDERPLSHIHRHSSTAAQRRKHESYSLSGSVFLITGNGKTLNLPAPSASPADPLGWSKWKRAGAFFAVAWFSIVALAVAQAAGIFMRVISRDFKVGVSTALSRVTIHCANAAKDIEPWQMSTLVTMPTLFMGIGAFIWVPLTIGMGRRPVFLIACVTLAFATLGAGYSRNFPELITCVCFMGLGEGFALTVVSACSMLTPIDYCLTGCRHS
jgi:MFS family permease